MNTRIHDRKGWVMTTPQTSAQPSERSDLEAVSGDLWPDREVRNDIIESRARLCFRALALALAAAALTLIAISLHAVTGAFIDRARVAVTQPAPQTSRLLAPIAGSAAASEPGPDKRGAVASDCSQAIVAVISILLIGKVVLAIGLIRATFSLRINSDAEARALREPPCESTPLPGVELLKAMTEAFGTVLKGLPKR